MSKQNLKSLVAEVHNGNIEAAGPLMDLLEETQDWRFRDLRNEVGLLINGSKNVKSEFTDDKRKKGRV